MDINILKTKVVTPEVRLNFENVWEPRAVAAGQEPKYRATFIFPKSDTETFVSIEKAIENAILNGEKSKFGGLIPTDLRTPLRDGDLEKPGDKVYQGCYFINASSRIKPAIVNRKVEKIVDRDEVYSGCFVRASISFYPYKVSGNSGITCVLNGIQKLKDGNPLGRRSTVVSDFADDFDNEEESDVI